MSNWDPRYVSGNCVSERHPLYKVLSIENFDRNAVKAAFLAKKNEQRVKLKDKRLKKGMLGPKSLYRNPAVGDFYGRGIEIWAGFGPVRQLLRPFFSCFHWQFFFKKNIVDGENILGIERS